MMTLTRNNFPIFIILLICAATLGSCDDKEFINPGGKAISFSVADTGFPTDTDGTRTAPTTHIGDRHILTDEGATDTLYMFTTIIDTIAPRQDETRGKLINSTSDLEKFKVFAQIKTSGETSWKENFFMNETATKSDDGVWTTENTYYWPGANYSLRFFAVSPAPTVDDESAGTKDNGLILPTDPSSTSFTYTVPSTASAQPDIMIATSTSSDDGYLAGNYNLPISLTFEHLCTAIKFKTDDETAAKITSIRLIGIGSSATYSFAEDKWNEPTVVNDANTPFIAENITDEDQTFMMIPQTLPPDATIEIVYDGKTLTANVGGQVWDKSTTVVYNVSVINWDYTFEVTPINTVFAHTGATSTELFSVISYKKDADNPSGDEIPVNCEVEVLTDDEEWVTVSEPSVVDYTYTYSGAVAAQTKSVAFDPADILKKMPAKGSENNPYNLSNSTGSNEVQNTANCYVVNAPGTYSFPLVYGNAIKGGMNNVDAYTTSNSGDNILSTFVNHKDDPIQYPYIKDNADCAPDNVALVWQDAEGLVDADNIRLIDCSTGNVATENTAPQNYRVVFEVPQTTIKPGNAVIAVRSGNNTILWSWHIWVTDYVLGTDLKRVTSEWANGGSYEMMPYNLGWCGDKIEGYATRGLKLRISQQGSSYSREVVITQSGPTECSRGNNPFYQWGRKDPMLPRKAYGVLENKVCYGSAFSVNRNKTSIGGSIQNPFVFYASSNWCNSVYYNLWSVSCIGKEDGALSSVKSIYDPCPAGYKLPVLDTFHAFCVETTSSNIQTGIFGRFDSNLYVWYFETDVVDVTVDFLISGARNSSTGELFGDNQSSSGGYFWTVLPGNDNNTGRSFICNGASTVYPYGNNHRSQGNPIRAIKE